MADLSEEVPIKDAATAISQGKRHLLVRDYNLAVVVLAQACELLAQEHGETGDEMGELYLLYGRALLGLAREEAGVLGGGVPGSEEVSQDEGVSQGEEEDEEDENEEGTIAENKNGMENSPCTSNDKEDDKRELKESEDPNSEQDEKSEKTENSDKTIDSKVEENTQKEEIPGCSRDPDVYNGEASGSGTKREDDEEDGEAEEEDVEKEDDVNNLQIAWEVLELAKLVLLKRGSSGWKLLAEAYRLLGEVAMEGGNHESALIDFKACLNLLEKITPRDHRAIAEIHYQLGLTHAMANNFDASIEEFNQASALLEAKIVQLKTVQDDPPQSDDPFYTVEGEIKELQELLPEIQEKIADIKDMKKEADVIKEIKEERLNGCSKDGEASEASGSGSNTSKPASDISHLVRKKRKAEDEEDIGSVCKKPLQEKDVKGTSI
ncbi:Nuclear autoantigenic sperm protein [Camponotus floridanus]|uniref:Nuclear autoantigenic sperm protein n=1 Tax=Camponotus floridanus TaxID=104421 RepID=E2AB21_CAMFO|nr:Nuclear autoantigenic sperm protein [Camponotus floridanus]